MCTNNLPKNEIIGNCIGRYEKVKSEELDTVHLQKCKIMKEK